MTSASQGMVSHRCNKKLKSTAIDTDTTTQQYIHVHARVCTHNFRFKCNKVCVLIFIYEFINSFSKYNLFNVRIESPFFLYKECHIVQK